MLVICINIEAKATAEAKRNAHLQAKKELEEKRRIADEERMAQIQDKKDEDERKRLAEEENAHIQAEKDAEEKERIVLGKHILLLHSPIISERKKRYLSKPKSSAFLRCAYVTMFLVNKNIY